MEKMHASPSVRPGWISGVSEEEREALPCTEPEQMVSGSQFLRGLIANRKSLDF
jgi:hypothetical protein